MILPAGHTSKANAIGYMPMVLGGVYLLYRGRMLLGAALLALFLGLEVMMNHVQVTYYLAILLALFVVAEGIRALREKTVGRFREAVRPWVRWRSRWPCSATWVCCGAPWNTASTARVGPANSRCRRTALRPKAIHTGG